MAFLIKESELKVAARKIMQDGEDYCAFPSTQQAKYDPNEFLAIGLLPSNLFDSTTNDQILIAIPNAQGTFYGDYPFITYSLTDEGWQLDEDCKDVTEDRLDEPYQQRYQQALEFFKQHKYLNSDLEAGNQSPLFELGGQPPIGQNWACNLYDEMEDNPDLDRHYDALEEGEGEEFEYMSTRELTYFDEDLEKEFFFLGWFSYDLYLDAGGECMVFYQPELKKVMVVAEFS